MKVIEQYFHVALFSMLYKVVQTLKSVDETLRPWQTRTHCCRQKCSPFVRARNICCGHKFVFGTQKMFLILFRNILCRQQMFPSLRSPRNIMENNVSATICPRLPGPLVNDHSNESYWAVLSCGTVFFRKQAGSKLVTETLVCVKCFSHLGIWSIHF